MAETASILRRAAIIGAAILLTVVMLCATALAWYDGDRLGALATSYLNDRYGIALEIGQLERSYALKPHVRITNLKMSNATATERTLLDVSAASFRIRPWTFLFDPLTLEDLVIDGVNVSVPVDEDGARYWDPLVAAVSDWFHRFDWSIRKFELRNLRAESRHLSRENELLIAASEVTGTMPRAASLSLLAMNLEANLDTALPLRLNGTAKIARLELAHEDSELPVSLAIDGYIQDRELTIRMAGGNLLDGDPSARDPVTGRISLGDVVTTLEGTMSRDDERHVDLSVTLVSRTDQAVDLSLAFELADPGRTWQLRSIRGEQGDSKLTGDIEIINRDERRKLNGKLLFSHLTFPRETTEQADSGASITDVIPEGDLYPQLLKFTREFDAELDITAEESVVFHIPFEELNIATLLDHGVLSTTIDKSTIKQGELEATFRIQPGASTTELNLQANLANASLGAMLARVEKLQGASGSLNGEVSIAATGDTLEEVLGSLAGKLALVIESGRIPDSIAAKLGGNVFAALFANGDSGEMAAIRCAIVEFDVDNGVAVGERMVMELDDYALYGDGQINMPEQQIDIRLVPRANDFSLIATRMPLRIHGPFRDVALDPVVSEGLLSLLTPVELGQSASAGCVGSGESSQGTPVQ